VTATSTIAAFWLVCPSLGESVRGIQLGLATFRMKYVTQYRVENGFDHSIFAVIKKVFPAFRSPDTLSQILSVYLICVACFGVVLFFVRIRHLSVANQVLCLCIASILLPPTSHDYTLMHLYIPWVLLVFVSFEYRALGQRARHLGAAFFCFAILFSPENEFLHIKLQFGGQIKAITLIVLSWIALRDCFPSFYDQKTRIQPSTMEGLQYKLSKDIA
jgi:hypothetical protein